MINDLNINIFNYIFSINEDIVANIKEDKLEYRQELNNKISSICELQDFWDEYNYYFNDKCVAIIPGCSGVKYSNFPRMKLDMKKIFLDYKAKQIEEIICNNGDLIENELEKIFINIENLGRKILLDYCENKGIIKYKGRVFIEADDHPACAIIYDNIEPVIYNRNNEEINPNVIQNIFNGNNYGTLNQSNNFQDSNEKLYEIVLEKLELMRIESNLSDEKINDIKELCNKKEKGKIIKFLTDIAMGTGTNLIASGILNMFGLM